MNKALVLSVLLLASIIPGADAGDQGRNETPQWVAELAPASGNPHQIQSNPNFATVVKALTRYLEMPTQAQYDDFQEKFTRMEKSLTGDWLAMLFEVFKESRRDTLEQQKYWLKRLEERNKINDAIQGYMRELVEQSQRLNEKVRRANDDAKSRQTVRVEVKDFDVGPQAQETEAHLHQTTPNSVNSSTRSLGREDLNTLMNDVDIKANRARNEALKAKASFDRWSEKGKQADQQLLTVLRKMEESRRRARKMLPDHR